MTKDIVKVEIFLLNPSTSCIYSLVFGMQMQSCPHLQEQRQKLASVGLTDIINQVKIIYICLIIDSSVSVYSIWCGFHIYMGSCTPYVITFGGLERSDLLRSVSKLCKLGRILSGLWKGWRSQVSNLQYQIIRDASFVIFFCEKAVLFRSKTNIFGGLRAPDSLTPS